MFVIQQRRRFLNAVTILNQFIRPLLPQFRKPGFGMFAHFLQEMPLLRPQGDAAVLRQRGRTPLCRLRPFGPVLDVVQTGVHSKRVEG
jgi:hypothetical protein